MVALCAGPGRKVRRVLRGGAFNNEARNVRCAYRNRNNPNNRNNNIGFRLVSASHILSLLLWCRRAVYLPLACCEHSNL